MVGLLMLVSLVSRGLAADTIREGLQAPEGFEVTLYADDSLAHDIYSLTIDAQGRVVVAGRGYVKILLDEDADGTADTVRQFADGPANGAMGMFWDGSDLICTGDAGLLRYRDADGDDRADGPPTTLLEAKTGGEHDVHALRKGPDGWWYLLGGNAAGLDERYVTLPSSPVEKPEAGALLRLTPDFTASEVIADGFRNPYDFAFDGQGSLLTYDSDGERDISLPWYRPTRVFEILPGASAGWVSRSWKHPDHYFDMPAVVAEFGRGSPTGVEAYRHTQFPAKYRGGLFVLDWTYGRVLFVPRSSGEASETQASTEEFLAGIGSFGFAPTDVAVGPDGSLFVSVGGRGTRGGVYRVRWKEGEAAVIPEDPRSRCLQAPQPLSSWSRSDWEPIARGLGAKHFREAALDPHLPVAERVRAVEILTELFGGVDAGAIEELAATKETLVRARTAWMIGRTGGDGVPVLPVLLEDREPAVVRAALEALLTRSRKLTLSRDSSEDEQLVKGLLAAAQQANRDVRQLAARVLSRIDGEVLAAVGEHVDANDWPAQMTLGYAETLRQPGFSPSALERAVRCLRAGTNAERIEAVRIAALALGGVGPGKHAPVFDGYAASTDLTPHGDAIKPLVDVVLELFPAADALLDRELTRLLGITQQEEPAALAALLAQLTADSHPVEDIHRLIVAARLPFRRSDVQRNRLAEALLRLDEKIESRRLHRDLNWDDRIGEMYTALVNHDSQLPAAVIGHDRFGEPGHVYFAAGTEGDLRKQAVDAIVRRASSQPDYGWTSDVVRFLAPASHREDVRTLLHAQVEHFGVRSAVFKALAQFPRPQDRGLLVEGLQSADLDVLHTLLQALERLGPDQSAAEQVALVRMLRRLGDSTTERRLQQAVLQQLQRNTGRRTTGSLSTEAAVAEWSTWVAAEHPDVWAARSGGGAALTHLTSLNEQLQQVDWTAGDPRRGEQLFASRSCQQCHGGRRALGPDLAGVARRFSREDLFRAIAIPNQDVSPRYQTTLIVSDAGHAHTGIVIYESIDGLLLRNGQGETIRIEADQIEVRRQLSESLMPTGLLKDLTSGDLADLYAYLATID